MAQNYQETTISGTSYVRGREVTVINQLGGYKGIMFAEERVSVFGETIMRENIGAIHQELTPDNAGTPFPLLDTETGEPVERTAPGRFKLSLPRHDFRLISVGNP